MQILVIGATGVVGREVVSQLAATGERDIAAVAVRALCGDRYSGAEHLQTGPESLTQIEQIATIDGVLGRPLCIEEIPAEGARRELLAIIRRTGRRLSPLIPRLLAASLPIVITSNTSQELQR